MSGPRYQTLEGVVIITTDQAVKVSRPDLEEVWVPRSLCEGGDTLDEGDQDPQVAAWWLRREGLA